MLYELPDEPTLINNIIDTYNQSTPAEISQGYSWYETAHIFALGLSEHADITLRQSAGIIAALSPQTSWALNQVMATDLVTNGTTHGLPLSVSRATAILHSATENDPFPDPLEILGGPKVRSFYANILDPYTANAVTIDRHAHAIAIGHVPSTQEAKTLDRKGYYERCAAAYIQLADTLKMLPHELQAITWITHRRQKGIVDYHTDMEEF